MLLGEGIPAWDRARLARIFGHQATRDQALADMMVIEGIPFPLPGQNPCDCHNPGLRFAGPGLLSERRSAAHL